MNSARLDELEKVAAAAKDIESNRGSEWCSALIAFSKAASPDTILELIHKLRVAEAALEIAVADANGASLPTLSVEHYVTLAERELEAQHGN